MNVTVNRRSTGARVLLVLMVSLLLFLVVAVLAVAGAVSMAHGALDGVVVNVDGERWFSEGPGAGQVVAAGVALLITGLVLVTVLPLALALALGTVVLALGLVALPLLLVVLVVLSPLWLVVLLVWWAMRRPSQPATTMSR